VERDDEDAWLGGLDRRGSELFRGSYEGSVGVIDDAGAVQRTYAIGGVGARIRVDG
jgi:hypothetical protein